MPIDYAELKPGQIVSNRTFTLDSATVREYMEAVGDQTWPPTQASGPPLAPPMAIAGIGLGGAVSDLGIPGGTLHTGQELEFSGVVHLGETLGCQATLLQNSVRGPWRFIVVELTVDNSDGRQVVRGKSTIMLPQPAT